MRYALDASTRRPPGRDVVIGGSPLRVFRLTPAGIALYERIAAGHEISGDESATVAALLDRFVDAGAIHPLPVSSPFTAADVTLVVPAFGVGAGALAPILAASSDVGAVIVVDDGTTSPIAAVAGAQVLRLRTNAGPAVARNAGLGAVTTPLVAFVDTDVHLGAGWLQALLAHFGDERVGLVAPRVASSPAPGRLAGYEQRHSSLDLGPARGRISPGTRLGYAPAAAMVARTAAMREIDGFARELRVGEDVDAVWRLIEAGWRCRYEPASVVHHLPRPTWRRFADQRVAYGSSAAPLARRHPGALTPLRVSGWSAGAWGLLVTGHPIGALGVVGATAAALTRKLPGVPAAESLRLAGLGHLHAGRQIADAARRAWWPALVVGSLVSRRVRRLTALAAVGGLADGGPIRLVDDLAYGVGVWKGALATREYGPLRPDLSSWPGRRHS